MTPNSLKPQYAPARAGDIMASAADISLARETLNFEPAVSFEAVSYTHLTLPTN